MTTGALPSPQVFNESLTQCWQALQGGRTIAVYRCLIDITGSLKAAIMLSQLMYWTRVSKEVAARDGWIYKSIAEMEEETGLTTREQRGCKEKLYKLNLLLSQRKGVGAPLALKINLEQIALAICKHNKIDLTENLTIAQIQSQTTLFFRRYFSQRIAYHRDLVTVTGCIHAAIMLSHMMRDAIAYSNHQGHLNERQCAFASLTIKDWTRQVNLPYKSQLTARQRLKAEGFIFEKHFYASRRIFSLVNGKRILAVLAGKLGKKTSLAERANSVWRKGHIFDFKRNNSRFEPKEPNSKTMTFGSDKRENSEVTKGEIKKCQKGKLRKYKWGNSEVTKGEIVLYFDYSKFDYNYYKRGEQKPLEATFPEVVVVPDAAFSPQQGDHCEGLIWPKQFTGTVRVKAKEIFKRHLPNGTGDVMQEVLDEIAGQVTEVRSPLGLLNKLVIMAANDSLICVYAPIVQNQRREARLWQQQQDAQNEPKLPDDTDNTKQELPRGDLMAQGREALSKALARNKYGFK